MNLIKRKVIKRKGPSGESEPYLIRWSIFTCRWFAIKLHRILISDEACLHDHPWTFISFILWGGYVEETPKGKRLYGPGSILIRRTPSIHRLHIFQPATTLVITFRKVRNWGFHTPKGWLVWWRYKASNECE